MKFQDVLAAWDAAPLDAIHPTRSVSEEAYRRSGEAQAKALAPVLPKNGRVVDFGCGDGRVTIPLYHLGVDVVGVDASPKMLDALSASAPEVPTRLSDGSDLAEQLGEPVDALICLAVLIHHDYSSSREIIANLRRAVRRGGRLILDWPVSETPTERRAWIEVTTWGAEQQAEVAKELGLRRVKRKLDWSVWTVT